MARVRWECPNGHPALLGSTRPPLDATVRFCLLCSVGSSRLVKRTAPALERERAARSHTAALRRQNLRDAREREERAYYTVCGIDVRELLRIAWALPVCKEWRGRRSSIPRSLPKLIIRRIRSKGRKTTRRLYGEASPWKHQIMIVSFDDDTAPRVSTLLHEIAHLLVGRSADDGWHGPTFYATLTTLKREWQEKTGRHAAEG